ncbi:MAG: RIP metalloprotease RseP [Patescibacteria group bacterium]
MIWTVILFLLVLSVLVLAHEWGHFITARKLGVKVEEFGLGYPPRVFSWISKKTGVRWSLNAIPIGGFVKLEGENNDGCTKSAESFCAKPIWKRFIILFAGVFMNMVVAALFFTIALGFGVSLIVEGYSGNATIENQKLEITQVLAGSPAEQAGLIAGDTVLEINDQVFAVGGDVHNYLSNLGENAVVDFSIDRNGEALDISVVPSYITEIDNIGLGLAIYQTGIVHYPWYMLPVKGAVMTWWYGQEICIGLYNMIASALTGHGLGVEVSGPIGIAVMTGQAAQMGFVYLLQFGAILSINLAILNILPIPALDGGRILFLFIEAVARRPVNGKVEAVIHNIGFLILMLIVVLVTYKDVLGLFK